MGPMLPSPSEGLPMEGLRERLQAGWLAQGGDARAPLPLKAIAQAPLVMSERLHAAVAARVRALCDWLQAQADAGVWAADPTWPGITRPDVLAADLAVVRAPDAPGGWTLRWVEFQAFHSVAVSAQWLSHAWQALVPELQAMQPHELPVGEQDWAQCAGQWLAPGQGGEAGVLLEQAPLQQGTAFDLLATARLAGFSLAQPAELERDGRGLLHRDATGRVQPVHQVLNRLILHEDPQRARTEALLAGAAVRWSGHPAWFDRIHKGLLPALLAATPSDEKGQPAERCVRADAWRTLGLPAEALVLKSSRSWGGAAVRMQVSAQALDALPDAAEWVVQPRYEALPLAHAHDGAPLYGELRCMVALPPGGRPWLASRFARLSRGPMASARHWSGLPGEGLAPVYAPPGAVRVFG